MVSMVDESPKGSGFDFYDLKTFYDDRRGCSKNCFMSIHFDKCN